MKRLSILAILVAVGLSGCHKAPPVAATAPPNDKPSEGSAALTPASRASVPFKPETGSLLSSEDVPLLEQINRENVRVLAAALPTIVRITASRQADPHMEAFRGSIPFPFHIGPGMPHGIPPSYGSGVVISKDGYIATNFHVVEDATDVQVELSDKRTFTARVVAADAPIDVAVLKIEAANLAALPWGDSDKVHVGEQVFAIGNPFNLDESASKGVVSAMRRHPEISAGTAHYEDYIQTDAAINPGNSGGALINIHGELIGINTAIASLSRGNMGVGFAIPSNLARYAVEGLLKDGRLVRGFLGVRLPQSVDDGVGELLHLGSEPGALLAGVQSGSPAEKAGLHACDFITEMDGHKINGIDDLRLTVSQLPVGKDVAINYIRSGAPQSTSAKIGDMPQGLQSYPNDEQGAPAPPLSTNPPASAGNVLSGLQVGALDDKSRQKFSVDKVVDAGVVVTAVEEGSPAENKGIQPGDVIESGCVDRGSTRPLLGVGDFTDLAQNLKPNESIVLLIHHGNAPRFVFLAPQPR